MDIINGFYLGADNKEHQIHVSSPAGGGSFHVYVDHFLYGQVVPSPEGWYPYIDGYVLNSDDIGAIVDLIEEHSPIASYYKG